MNDEILAINNESPRSEQIKESSQNEEETRIKAQIESLKKQLPKKPRRAIKLPVALTKEEFTELIKHTKQKHHKLAFLLGFGAGLRISEVINLEPRHIRLNEKNILIEQGKGSKDRVVALPQGFKEDYIKLLPLKCNIRALQKAFKATAKRAGLLNIKPTLHFHSLRHGFATNLAGNGMPIHELRQLMGHTNISTTNVYLNANPQQALKSYEKYF